MKKLLTLTLMLIGFGAMSMAENLVTVYMKPNSNWIQDNARFAINLFGGTAAQEWFNMTDSDRDGIYEYTFDSDKYTTMIFGRMDPNKNYNSFTQGDPLWNQSANLVVPSENTLYTQNGNTWNFNEGDYTTATSSEISSVTFSWGITGQSVWNSNELIKDGESYTYTGVVDMSNVVANQNFKLVINGIWKGQNQITVSALDGLISAGAETGAEITLNHATNQYLTYNITATWTPGPIATAGWTVTIAGGEPAVSNTYTVNFVKGWNDWTSVYAYVWDAQGTAIIAGYPGTQMTTSGNKKYGYDVYTLSFNSHICPTKIQFNDGADHKVDNLDFENGMTYEGVSYQTFTVTDAGWATAKTTANVDFTDIEGLEAYTATVSEKYVTLKKVNVVPNNTALVLKGIYQTEVTKNVPIAADANSVTNALEWFDNYNVTSTDSYAIYGLTAAGGNAEFTRVAEGETITNKALLRLPKNAARELKVVFADEASGINAVTVDQSVEGIFNLNGQRVAAPAKGLYIVNGKKVILK